MTQPADREADRSCRIKQSVCRWCYDKIPLPDFFKAVADMGLTAVDLLNEEEWTVAKDFGLTCSMGFVGAGSIPDRPQQHQVPRHDRQCAHHGHSRRPRPRACRT